MGSGGGRVSGGAQPLVVELESPCLLMQLLKPCTHIDVRCLQLDAPLVGCSRLLRKEFECITQT